MTASAQKQTCIKLRASFKRERVSHSAKIIPKGSYANVYETPDTITITVDHIQSIPLFYLLKDDTLWVSDDPFWIIHQTLSEEKICMQALQECLSAGYVTGNRTLIPNLYQVPAGNSLEVNRSNGKVQQVIHNKFLPSSEKINTSDWYGILDSVFRKTIEELQGRPVVLPLSGGYDSRLIAFMLKEHGYKDVTCFCYGQPRNEEAQISEQVAQSLGYPWIFIPYTHKGMQGLSQSTVFQEYLRFGSQLRSIAHVQDFAAVLKLREKNAVPNNAVFIPGHSLDFLAGSHIPSDILKREISLDALCQHLYHKHFCLWKPEQLKKLLGLPPKNSCTKQEHLSLIREQLKGFRVESPEDFVAASDYWNWQERQSKFIVNSVRVYEYLHYDWMLPLWSPEIMHFWEKVPFDLRLGKAFFLNATHTQQKSLSRHLKIASPQTSVSKSEKLGIRPILRKLFQTVKFIKPIKRWRHKLKYAEDPLCLYGLFPEKEFLELFTGSENANAFIGLLQCKVIGGSK